MFPTALGRAAIWLLAAILLRAHAAGAAPAPADSAAWAALASGAEGVYATLWSAHGVVGCRGSRGPMPRGAAAAARSALEDASVEARLRGTPHPARGVITFLRDGRGAAPDEPFDPSSCALLVEGPAGTAVILPGEARTSSYAWREARRRAGATGPTVAARIFRSRQAPLNSQEIQRWLGGSK